MDLTHTDEMFFQSHGIYFTSAKEPTENTSPASLHWLPVQLRIDSKLPVLVFKGPTGPDPASLSSTPFSQVFSRGNVLQIEAQRGRSISLLPVQNYGTVCQPKVFESILKSSLPFV